MYHPRSHSGFHNATVIGRTVRGQGWQIRLESGAIKEVDDSEAWRITPVSSTPQPQTAGGVLGASSAATNQGSGHSRYAGGTVSVSPPVAACEVAAVLPAANGAVAPPLVAPSMPSREHIVTAGSSLQPRTMQVASTVSLVTPTCPTTECPPMSCQQAAAAVAPTAAAAAMATAAPSVSSRSCQGSSTATTNSLSFAPTSRCVTSDPTTASRQVPSTLQLGQRIAYTARSNGVRYPGRLLGRLPNRGGWRVLLDCGDTKEVDDAEAWRLTTHP